MYINSFKKKFKISNRTIYSDVNKLFSHHANQEL